MTRAQTILTQAITKLSESFFSTKSYLSNAIWRNPIALIQREIQITKAIYWKNNRFLFTTPYIITFINGILNERERYSEGVQASVDEELKL